MSMKRCGRASVPFVVILDHHDIGAVDVHPYRAFEACLDVGTDRLLEIDPQHLLAAADDTHFENRRPVSEPDEFASDVRSGQLLPQRRRRIVVTDDAYEGHVEPQRREIQRHVRGTTRSILARLDVDDRHRRLLRHATGFPIPIAIEHHVPNDENGSVAKRRDLQLHASLGRTRAMVARCNLDTRLTGELSNPGGRGRLFCAGHAQAIPGRSAVPSDNGLKVPFDQKGT